MARRHLRFLPLVRRQCPRWGLVSVLPLALCSCKSKAPDSSVPEVWEETDFSVLISPEREIDILFMVDNSPSMDPKQQRLAENFPKMIQVLQQIPDSSGGVSLPDVHIGVISSDMGEGSAGGLSGCRRLLGERGLLWGNDPNNLIASVAPNSPYANDPSHP